MTHLHTARYAFLVLLLLFAAGAALFAKKT
jgi:hypothetical protein